MYRFLVDPTFCSVSVGDAATAFASGSSPANAIAVPDETDVNGNPSIEIEDLDLDKMMDVNSAIAVEKEIAADTIGTLFAATQLQFLPFVEPCTLELIALLPHYYEGIRKSATDSLLEIVRTFYDLSDHEEWVPGFNSVSCLFLERNAFIVLTGVAFFFLAHSLEHPSPGAHQSCLTTTP
jgi:hypothetical protein